jgi:hypothetical protein
MVKRSPNLPGRRGKRLAAVVGVMVLVVTLLFTRGGQEADARTMRLGFIGRETSARVDLDMKRHVAVVSGGQLGDVELVLQDGRISVRGTVIGLTLPNDPWVSFPAELVMGAGFPRTFESLVSSLTRKTKECPLTGIQTLATIRLLFGHDIAQDPSFSLCGAGINGGGFANGINLRVLAEDVEKNEATLFDLEAILEVESVGEVLSLSSKLATLLRPL